jgi:glycosyltransferase involved in cell wall biosynthesis
MIQMSGLRILWFNWRCWVNPAMGGAEVFTREVAKRWAESGHDVTLFTSEYPGCTKEAFVDGVKIIRAGGRFSVYRQAKKFYSKRFKDEKFDIIIDEINTVPFLVQKFAKKGEKVVALIHQLAREFWFYEMPFPLSYLGYYYLENRWLRQYVNVLTFTVSESTRRDLAHIGFQDVSVLPEGLNFSPLDVLPAKDSKPVVAFAGRLNRAKRPDHAVKAFKIIKDKIPNAELWVFGDGPFRQAVERIAGSGVKFFGNLSNQKRRDFLSRCWVLMVPGLREGWGLNVIEANALGVPAVAYDVPGLCDSVRNGETGFLVEQGCVEGLAAKTIDILLDRSVRASLSSNALFYAKQFCWDKTANEFMKRIVDG